MRIIVALLFTILIADAYAQKKAENLIIITTDGFRWQELFHGMDTALANNKKYNEYDSAYIYQRYWSTDVKERRQKLLPFLWSTIEAKGQLYGNRTVGNKVNVANRYWFSYPGYNEIMTGYPDTLVNTNGYKANPHVTVLEYLNNQPALKNKIAAFGAWEAFDRILNEQRSGIPVTSAFDSVAGKKLTVSQQTINRLLKDSYRPWGSGECLDVFTHHAAMEYLKANHPKVLYIAYGETDEWAHAGQYRSYLDAAHQVDAWIREVWDYVQADPVYRNNTTIYITTDHGRGDLNKKQWTDHGSDVPGASEIWIAAIGTSIKPAGEIKTSQQIYQQQLAATFARALGYTYTPSHPVAEPIKTLLP